MIRTAPPAPQFRIVHAVRISHDGLVYVCDRTNNRIQVFRKDGTFVQEVVIAKETFGSGSVWDIGFTPDPDQTFSSCPTARISASTWSSDARCAWPASSAARGHWAGQFYGAHNLAVNAKGDLFITETYRGQTRSEIPLSWHALKPQGRFERGGHNRVPGLVQSASRRGNTR